MPTFTHIFYGLCLLIPILYFAREKFSYKLAFIFLVNNIFGPDVVFLFSFIDPGFHSIIGFCFLAIPLALVFSYLSRFSVSTGDKFYELRLTDTEIKDIPWLYAYFATVAGGISHFFIDQFFHWEQEMILLPNLRIPIDDLLAWSGDAYHTMNPIMIIGEVLVVIMLLLSPFMFKKGVKETLILFGVGSLLAFLLMIVGSTEIFGGEREYAGMFATFIYFFIPLMLLFSAARYINDHPQTEKWESKLKWAFSTRYYVIVSISLVIGLIMFAYGLVALILTDTILDLIGGLAVATKGQIKGLAVFYGLFGLLLFGGSIGLFFKSKVARICVIIGASYFIILGFPIGITGFLFENETKVFLQLPQEEK